MPWSYPDNVPPFVKNKSEEEQKLAVEVANKTLAKTGDEDSAVFAAIASVKNLKKKTTKSIVKPLERNLPNHIPTKERIRELEITEEQIIKAVSVPKFLDRHDLPQDRDRNVIAANFNQYDQLVILFDTGETITTDAINIQQIVENYVTAGNKTIILGEEVDYVQQVFIGDVPASTSYDSVAFERVTIDGQEVFRMKACEGTG